MSAGKGKAKGRDDDKRSGRMFRVRPHTNETLGILSQKLSDRDRLDSPGDDFLQRVRTLLDSDDEVDRVQGVRELARCSFLGPWYGYLGAYQGSSEARAAAGEIAKAGRNAAVLSALGDGLAWTPEVDAWVSTGIWAHLARSDESRVPSYADTLAGRAKDWLIQESAPEDLDAIVRFRSKSINGVALAFSPHTKARHIVSHMIRSASYEYGGSWLKWASELMGQGKVSDPELLAAARWALSQQEDALTEPDRLELLRRARDHDTRIPADAGDFQYPDHLLRPVLDMVKARPALLPSEDLDMLVRGMTARDRLPLTFSMVTESAQPTSLISDLVDWVEAHHEIKHLNQIVNGSQPLDGDLLVRLVEGPRMHSSTAVAIAERVAGSGGRGRDMRGIIQGLMGRFSGRKFMEAVLTGSGTQEMRDAALRSLLESGRDISISPELLERIRPADFRDAFDDPAELARHLARSKTREVRQFLIDVLGELSRVEVGAQDGASPSAPARKRST